jgi:signal transduction histidine kinase/ligand-binding sensor domain-containing protein/DNA-binding response OmpR family regulator
VFNPLEGLKIECILQDKSDFLWLGTYMGLYRFDGQSTQLINHTLREGIQLSDKSILCMYEDQNRQLWIGTENGINCLNKERTEIRQHLVEKEFYLNGKNNITTVTQDTQGTIWCGSRKGSVFALNQDNQFQTVPNTLDMYPDKLFSPVLHITPDQEGYLWVATLYRGIYKMSTEGKILEHYPFNNLSAFKLNYQGQNPVFLQENIFHLYNDLQSEFVTSIPGLSLDKSWLDRTLLLKDEQYIWFSYDFKLYRWHIHTHTLEDFSSTYLGFEQLVVTSMYQDLHRNYWLSTPAGLIKISYQENCFTVIAPPLLSKDDYFSTRGIVETGQDTLYIGSYQGFFEYHLQDQSFREYRFQHNNQWINPIVRAIIKDSTGNLWLGSESFGLFHFDIRTHKFTPVKVKNTFANHPNPDLGSGRYICALLRDHKNRIWAGTYNGAFILDTPDGVLRPFVNDTSRVALHNLTIRAIHQSPDHSIWLATNGGLFKISEDLQISAHYTSDSASLHGRLSNNYVNYIYEDKDGSLWLGLKGGGINKLDPGKGIIARYTVNDGLASDEVYSIIPGKQHELWITTLNGLSRLDLTQQTFRNFFTRDGLPGNEFNHGSFLAAKNGKLYLGGISGIVSFFPSDLVKEVKKPLIKLTRFIKHDGPNNQNIETSFAIENLQRINLHHTDKFFTLHFALANYFETAKCQFAYKLDGISNDWQYIGSNNFIQFAGLPAGDYTLQLKGAGNDGTWVAQPLRLAIHVEQAYYATFWAYLLYTCLLALILFLGVRFQWNRIKLQNQLKLEHLHNIKLEELDRMKSQLFTDIAHEFRTPLTLILGPAEKIHSEASEHRYKNWASTILRNSRQLLGMIDQLLDLSKLEAGTEKLNLSYQDIILFIKENTWAVQSLADQQHIQLSFQTDIPELKMSFDPEKLQKILYNLLSNACKFTPPGGTITISVNLLSHNEPGRKNQEIEIRIIDTGTGIAKECLPFIFDRYYQVPGSRPYRQGGTGIGLAIVKEMVELHQGVIMAESEQGKGTAFTIHLPVISSVLPLEGKLTLKETAQEDVLRMNKKWYFPEEKQSLPEEVSPATEKPVILIADDHEGIRHFIMESLMPYYQVITAGNGVEGLKAAREKIPDLVISDVMMPGMDGHTFLHLLKEDEYTSHIPVILLTARSSQKSRIEGLKTGADMYLIKPFDVQELLLSIRNLLTLRQNIQKKFSTTLLTSSEKILDNPVDQSFLERFTSIVDKHLSDDTFGVEEMVSQIGMSRTQLHRKVKAITGESTSHLIRTIRLQRAIEMLKINSLSINEIAYQVGFSSASYFTESFTKHFGHPPTERRKMKA